MKERFRDNVLLFGAAGCLLSYCIFLQFLSPAFYESDSYYHIAVSNFIKDFGLRYQFHWAQFSTYKDFFADKDFLFHLSIVPFLSFSRDIVLAGKYAVIFYNFLFIVAYLFILKKYLPAYLAAIFLFLPFLSATFTTYLLYLRSFTLANILTILGIYFLINKKSAAVFIVAALYALAHTSYFMVVFFAFMCEIIRWLINKEFYARNIYLSIAGVLAGCFIHPNFPNNFLYTHLQFLAINYANKGLDLGFGSELFSYPTMRVFIENFAVFITLNFILWISLFSRVKVSFAAAVWLASANVYFLLALSADRHWYPANILIFIAFAAYLKNWLADRQNKRNTVFKINIFIIIYLLSAIVYLPAGVKSISANIIDNTGLGEHYKRAALWMKSHIPPGETVYHNNWSDPAYFLCFNPNNNYLVVLDPLYMYYRYPQLYIFYRDLSRGKIKDIYGSLLNIFKTKYGYAQKNNSFFIKIKNDPRHFKVLYEDDMGIIFQLN